MAEEKISENSKYFSEQILKIKCPENIDLIYFSVWVVKKFPVF